MNIEDLNEQEQETVETEEEIEEVAETEEATDEVEETEGEDQPEVKMTKWTDDEGVEWEIPENIAPALMKNKDYTQSKQALADQRRALEDERKQWAEQQKRDEEDFKIEGELFNIEERLKQYQNVNWGDLRIQDPDGANGHFQDMQLLQQRKQELSQTKQSRMQEKSQAAQQSVAKRHEETNAYISNNIPDWSPELANNMEKYALEAGFDADSMMSNMSPAFMKILYDGYKANEIRKRATTPKPKQTGKVMPLKQVGAKSNPTNRVDLNTASMDDFYKSRMRGVGG